jgi:hypothetical protein
MSDVLTAGSLENFSTWQIALVPLSALIAAGLAVWGLLNAQRGWIASILTSVAGLVGLYYYVDLYLIREGEVAEYIRDNIGLGSKIVFVGLLGLVLQIILIYPDANRAIQFVGRRLGF